MEKKISTTLVFEDKTFKTDDGKEVAYTSCKALICGEEIRLSVKKEDKALLEYLLKQSR